MTKRMLLIVSATVLLTGSILKPALAGKGNRGEGKNTQTVILTDAEAQGLLFMREEEKLARDVYLTLYERWGSRVFNNISQSEQKHMNAVLGLIEKYGLTDPASTEIGVFKNEELQDLYDLLIIEGSSSTISAFYVGALIEEVDIEDIVIYMDETDKADILNVYGNLLAGSENHLVAFVKNIERSTEDSYVAQYVKQEEVDSILGR